jgi:hypothetical protein
MITFRDCIDKEIVFGGSNQKGEGGARAGPVEIVGEGRNRTGVGVENSVKQIAWKK